LPPGGHTLLHDGWTKGSGNHISYPLKMRHTPSLEDTAMLCCPSSAIYAPKAGAGNQRYAAALQALTPIDSA
jgi:hypothetical protein